MADEEQNPAHARSNRKYLPQKTPQKCANRSNRKFLPGGLLVGHPIADSRYGKMAA